jgi:S-adenosylmethionine-diacylgycerolhomoserine-N-methlytransferase
MSNAGPLMDRIYTSQRHIYDATRKFYLLGRDGLIADLRPKPQATVLEVGCGTARNLIAVARRYPGVTCYGLDVSQAMLATARRSVARAGLTSRIHLAEADATAFDPQALFGVTRFDRVLISYALSMIPPWQDVLRHAGEVLAPGGSLHIVDFGDQRRLPSAFKRALDAWLARFHVTPRLTLPQEIEALAREQGLRASIRPRYRGYAVAAELVRP